MKLLSANTANGSRLAVKLGSGILIVSQAGELFPNESVRIPLTLQEALLTDGELERIEPYLRSAIENPAAADFLIPEDKVQVAQPFAPGNVICIGLNYKDHAEESSTPLPKQPVIFAKWTSAIMGPGAPIVLPPDTKEVDYEAELAVVIGRKCRNVPAERALDYVAGYTCMNDVSARDFQRADGQWVRAKSQDTFGPFGPYIVTKDEIPDPQKLRIRCLVNGRALQDSNTSKMIFGVRELIAYLSRGITLLPGTIISTGTPNGVGFAQVPPVFLQAGDDVVVEIESIGRLSNPVKA